MKCRNCGKDISINSVYCTECHIRDPFNYPKEDEGKKKKPSKIRVKPQDNEQKEIEQTEAEQTEAEQKKKASHGNSRSGKFILKSCIYIIGFLMAAILIIVGIELHRKNVKEDDSKSQGNNHAETGAMTMHSEDSQSKTEPMESTASAVPETTALSVPETTARIPVPQTQAEAFLYDLYQAFERKDYSVVAALDDSEMALEILDNMTGTSFYYIPEGGDTGVGAGIHLMQRADGARVRNYGFYYGNYENGVRSGKGSLYWTKAGSTDYYFLLEDAGWQNDTLNGYYEWSNYITVQGQSVQAFFKGSLKDGMEDGAISCSFTFNGKEESVYWESKLGVRGETYGRELDGSSDAVFGIRTAYLEGDVANTAFK